MGRDQTALSWLRRYDALLRERDEESRREQVVREIMKAKEDVLPPSFHLSRPEDPLGRRKRTARETLVPIFLPREALETRVEARVEPEREPEPSPDSRMFERELARDLEAEAEAELPPEARLFERAERASGVVPRHAVLHEAYAEPEAALPPPREDVEIDVELEEMPEAQALAFEAAPLPEPEAIEPEAIEPEAIEPEAIEPVAMLAAEAHEPLAIEPHPEPVAVLADEPVAMPEPEAIEPEAIEPAPAIEPEPAIEVIALVAVESSALHAAAAESLAEGPEDASAEISAALSFGEYADENKHENETTDGVPAVDEEPPSLPELAQAAAHAWSSIPPPPALVDDATTDAMAMPPAFTRPPPRITVLGPPPMDETTEPLDMSFPHEASIPIDLSPLGLSPLGVSPRGLSPVVLSPVAPVETSSPLMLSPPPPPSPRRVMQELSPPPLAPYRRMPLVGERPVELTPPSLPLANGSAEARILAPAPAPAPLPAPVAGEPIPLPTFDLKNPWAAAGDDDRPRSTAAAPKPSVGERLAPWKPAFRTLSLALLAATVGISVRGALALRANGASGGSATDAHAAAPLPVATTTTLQAQLAPAALPAVTLPAAQPAPAQAAEAALAAKVQGTLEVLAPADVPVVVDGIERGRGPKVTIQLGTGYHMVRVGTNVTQLVQVRAKQTSTMDVTKAN